ncbi:envelope integrity protein Cei [Gordonia shandongensis]|uniref:envelope integrity protein Cei n=1 Tax=Gordonia shandongensis TaxID=376351 RepID=UPI000424FB32|nr:envelope integrity protein Cei [Gordonia shandongensis]
MVSKIATGYTTDVKGRPFRRRHLTPAIIVVAVLAVAAITTWTVALTGSGDKSYPTDCSMPQRPSASSAPDGPEPVTLDRVSKTDLLSVAPAGMSTFKVRVLNSGAARGQARSVSDDLVGQGFTAAEPAYGDDTVYEQSLDCVAQIRFGPGGQGGAAAVWLAEPCAQLVNDGRTTTDVDLVLGEYHRSLRPSQDAQAALEALRSVDPKNPKTAVDRSLIEAVHSQAC